MFKRLPSSALVLLGSNLIALASALLFHWSALDIVLSYWIQSLFIGIFQRRKIIDIYAHQRIVTGKEWVVVSGTRIFAKDGDAGFMIIYGTFWAALGVVIYVSAINAENVTINWLDVSFQSVLFFATHWWSYHSNKKNDERRELDALAMAAMPFMRVFLPLYLMYFVMDFGSSHMPWVIVGWMLLKTVVDIGCHAIEHDKNRVKFT